MEKEGFKRVELIRKDDKRQITVTFAGSMNGNLLPLQVIYQGKKKPHNFFQNLIFPLHGTLRLHPTIGPTRRQQKNT